jgi:hydroxymethylpyrimidine/phosphomethylpyrimidine kinase
MTDSSVPVVLLFGGNDPVGGAGLAADIQALTARYCYPAPVVTALTVQDTLGVSRVEPVAVELVEQQARAVLNDLPVAAIKTGLLATNETVALVAKLAKEFNLPLIVDPVMKSGSGDNLADEALHDSYRQALLPVTLLVTPNTPEAQELGNADDADAQAANIIGTGCQWVLITGTHEQLPDVCHRLYSSAGLVKTIRQQRLPGEYHGSGCTLASACAAGVARQQEVQSLVVQALAYTQSTLENAFQLGKGQWLPNRMQ